jgi:hypothetical protein
MSEPVGVIFCQSRCLYCGRRTPHEVCHEHSRLKNPGWLTDFTDIDALWRSGDQEPETCNDPACPVWEPGEWEARRAQATPPPIAEEGR